MEFKQAVAEDLQKNYGITYSPETEILITPSGMDNLRLAEAAILDEGDEMIVNDPCWSNHPNHSKMAHGVPVYVPLKEENHFAYVIQDLEKAVTKKTKAILLNYPNNPTGAVISYEALTAFCDFCKRHGLVVISDEVYHDIIFDGLKFCSPAMIEGVKERVVISQSFSKSYAMTGWRLAYAAGPADIIDAMVAEFQNRRDIVYEGINQIDGLSCVRPQGAYENFICYVHRGDSRRNRKNKRICRKFGIEKVYIG